MVLLFTLGRPVPSRHRVKRGASLVVTPPPHSPEALTTSSTPPARARSVVLGLEAVFLSSTRTLCASLLRPDSTAASTDAHARRGAGSQSGARGVGALC